MQEKYMGYSNASIVQYNYVLLVTGNHREAIRWSKGMASQKDNSRCTLLSDRKANSHVNTYLSYY